MEIGEPIRTLIVEPLELPEPVRPVEQPQPVEAPVDWPETIEEPA